MNKINIKILVFYTAIVIQFFQTIQTSQFNPNIYYSKPMKDELNLSNPSITFSTGYAKKAFDGNGNTVPYLEQYGPEDFLQRFINPSLGPDNLETAGQGIMSGEYHFKQYRFHHQQNIHRKLVFGIIISIDDLNITDIKPRFISSELPLSDQTAYLEELEKKIPKTINQTGMYTTNLYFGYNEKLVNFNHIHSLQALFLVGISTPQSMKNDNRSILQFPLAANIHFGYPVVGSITVDVQDWVSFGFSGVVVPFQPVTMMIPINKTDENNHLLFSQSTLAKIDQEPFFAGTIYAEIKKPSLGLVGTIAYGYSQYLNSDITPTDKTKFPRAHANKSIVLDGYSLGSFLFQIDIDRTQKEKRLNPVFSFFISIPIAGELFPKTYLFGGISTFQVSHFF